MLLSILPLNLPRSSRLALQNKAGLERLHRPFKQLAPVVEKAAVGSAGPRPVPRSLVQGRGRAGLGRAGPPTGALPAAAPAAWR